MVVTCREYGTLDNIKIALLRETTHYILGILNLGKNSPSTVGEDGKPSIPQYEFH